MDFWQYHPHWKTRQVTETETHIEITIEKKIAVISTNVTIRRDSNTCPKCEIHELKSAHDEIVVARDIPEKGKIMRIKIIKKVYSCPYEICNHSFSDKLTFINEDVLMTNRYIDFLSKKY